MKQGNFGYKMVNTRSQKEKPRQAWTTRRGAEEDSAMTLFRISQEPTRAYRDIP